MILDRLWISLWRLMTNMDYDKYTTEHSSDLPLKENRSCCYFRNPNKIKLKKIQVDGGLISSSKQEKCDYIVHWQDSCVAYIELKGSDLIKAFSQVESTIRVTKYEFDSFKTAQCVIVCSRIRLPKSDSTVTKLKKKMKELTGTVPIVCSQQYNYVVDK